MLESLTEFIQQQEGPVANLLIGLAALIEYLVPPFPGDTLALVGVCLAVHAKTGIVGAYVSLTAFSTLGGWIVSEVARHFADKAERWPKFLSSPKAKNALAKVTTLFATHGGKVLAVNRFAPVARSFFFLGAGLCKVPRSAVIMYGALSAALWNVLLVAAALLVGANLEALVEIYKQYTLVSVLIVALLFLAWWFRRHRKQ